MDERVCMLYAGKVCVCGVFGVESCCANRYPYKFMSGMSKIGNE